MRTTIEFPLTLMRAAKARSAEQGESLKSLLSRALTAELGREIRKGDAGQRVVLPLFGAAAGPRVNPSNADLERALSMAEASRVPTPAPVSRPRARGRSRRR